MSYLKNYRFVSTLAVTAFAVISGYVQAAIVGTPDPVTITQSFAYASFGGGDFVFSTSVAVSGCESGWYMKATDPGYKAAVSTVLTAQAAGLQVRVYGDTSDLWSGSPSGHFCRMQTVGVSS
jgi:hypothetical protein